MRKLDRENGNEACLRQALNNCLAQSQEARFVQRALCLLLASSGLRCDKLARTLGKTPRTIERWAGRYAEHGAAGLWDEPKRGRAALLSQEEMQALKHDVAREPAELGYQPGRWTGAILAKHIRQRYGHALCPRQCQRLLSQWQRQAGRPAKATP
jgi:transposase